MVAFDSRPISKMEKLSRLSRGDYVISYVTGEGAGVLGEVDWKISLNEEEAILLQELKETIGWKPSSAMQKISDEKEKEKIVENFKKRI